MHKNSIRNKTLEKILKNPHFDMIIIGSGASGAGTAVEGSSRGYRVLCVDKGDFGQETSSKSTKLIHGGVRYLAQGNIKLVKDALQERYYCLNNTPHLSKPIPFVLPVYQWWEALYYYCGLKFYHYLSGKYALGDVKWISYDAMVQQIPGIKTKGLLGGIQYYDGQFDDSRLCMSLVKTAEKHGAYMLNYMTCKAIQKDHRGKICGVIIQDVLTQQCYRCTSTTVINATGVHTDTIKALDKHVSGPKTIIPSRGTHIVIKKPANSPSTALIIPRTTDGRVLFVVPWYDVWIVGTTDIETPTVETHPKPSVQEIEFIIKNYNHYYQQDISTRDILSVFCGLRPLVRSRSSKSSRLSRDHDIQISKSGLISLVGGKWTTYRKMAEDVLDTAILHNQLKTTQSVTKKLQLEKINSIPTYQQWMDRHLHMDLLQAHVQYCITQLYTETVEDYVCRRSRLIFWDVALTLKVCPIIATWMQTYLDYDDQWRDNQIKHMVTVCHRFSTS